MGCLGHTSQVYIRLIQLDFGLYCSQKQYLPTQGLPTNFFSITFAFQSLLDGEHRKKFYGMTQSHCTFPHYTFMSSHAKFCFLFIVI
jgi:hypothetical protein